jgi:hypothetical protein
VRGAGERSRGGGGGGGVGLQEAVAVEGLPSHG